MNVYTAIAKKMFPKTIKEYKGSERKPIIDILNDGDLDDALTSLDTLIPNDKDKIALYAIRCAENVLHIFENAFSEEKAPRLAIQAAKDYLIGNSDTEELENAIKSVAKVATEVVKVPHAARAAWAACNAAEAAKYSLKPPQQILDFIRDYSGELAGCAGGASRAARDSRRALAKDMADFAGETNNKGEIEYAAEMKFQVNLFKGIFGKTTI
jgi:hypothetical protein